MTAFSKILIGLAFTLVASLLLYGPMGFGRACVIGAPFAPNDLTALAAAPNS